MRMTIGRLKGLIEATWKVSAPARYNLPDVTVDAESSTEAGEKGAEEYGRRGTPGIDPMTISVEPFKKPTGSATQSPGAKKSVSAKLGATSAAAKARSKKQRARSVGRVVNGWMHGWDPVAFEDETRDTIFNGGDYDTIVDWVRHHAGSGTAPHDFDDAMMILSMTLDDGIDNFPDLEDAYYALQELRRIARDELGIPDFFVS